MMKPAQPYNQLIAFLFTGLSLFLIPGNSVAQGCTPTIVRLLIDPCEGDTYMLAAMYQSGNPLWSTGETTDTIWVTTTGTYSVTVTDPGCTGADSTVVTFHPLPQPTVSQVGNTLVCNQSFVFYQWYLNGNAINGATGQSHVITASGSYAVEVGDSNYCTNFSDTLLATSLETLKSFGEVKVFPNPATDKITLSATMNSRMPVRLDLTDITGRVLRTRTWTPENDRFSAAWELKDLAPGAYILSIRNERGTLRRRVIKQ